MSATHGDPSRDGVSPGLGDTPPPSRPRSSDGALTRRIARLVLVGLGVSVILGGALVAIDLFEVRAALTAARQDINEARSALADVEVEAASAAIRAADDELAAARARTQSMRWSVASVMPVAGRSIDLTRQVVEVGSAAVELADMAVAEGEQLLERGLTIDVADGRIDLGPLLSLRELVDGLPVDRLAEARDALAAPRRGWIPGLLLDGRDDSLELAEEALDVVQRTQALTTALPGFLGAEGNRRYFVGMQTPAELRGTGGLIGYFGVLSVEDGVITFGQSDAFEPSQTARDLDAPEQAGTGRISVLDGPLDEPVGTDAAFAARYGRLNAASDFSNINIDPDLPTTARVVLDLFEQRTGQSLDGVILLDPVGLESLLTVSGEMLPLAGDLAIELGLTDGVPTDRFATLTTIEIYETFGSGRHSQRQEVLRALGDAAFAQIVAGGWDSAAMIRAIAHAGATRHLQVFSERPDEQEAFTDIGVGGALPAPFGTDGADALVVVANNAVGGKQDVHLGHEFAIDVRLGQVFQADDGTLFAARAGEVGVTVDNPLPSSGLDEYIIGSCFRPGEDVACFQGDPGWNQTWFSAFLPTGTSVVAARSDEVSTPVSTYGTYNAFEVVDHFQVTPPESRGSFELDIDGWAPLTRQEQTITYELLWWRQAKAIPDLLDVRVQPPAGWRIADAEVIGGGDGRGFGVHGGGIDLTTEFDDGQVRLHGTVTADTRLRVHLTAAER
jgi:hypothetical protein